MTTPEVQSRLLSRLAHVGWPVGCVLLASIFLVSGGTKLFSPGETAAVTAVAGLPSAVWPVILVGLFEIAAGAGVALGYKRTWAAVALLVYLLFVTPVFHGFWRYDGAERGGQMVQFLKNTAVGGGLVFVACSGLRANGGQALRYLARLAVAAIFFANAFGIVSQERATSELVHAGSPAALAPTLIRGGQITQAVSGILLLLPFSLSAIAGPLLLAGFLVPATFVAHSFWIAPAEAFTFQLLYFFKNVSAVGALVLIAGWYALQLKNTHQQSVRSAAPLARHDNPEVRHAP